MGKFYTLFESKKQNVIEGVPLKGHPYHSKTDDELRYIVKDAGEAAESMKGHDTKAENKYRDQVNDASTVLYHRKNGGKRVQSESSPVSEALRKIGDYEGGNRKATVHKDSDWGEYRVKHHVDGKHQTEADYHTDDKEDAHTHAKTWTDGHATKNESSDIKPGDKVETNHAGIGTVVSVHDEHIKIKKPTASLAPFKGHEHDIVKVYHGHYKKLQEDLGSVDEISDHLVRNLIKGREDNVKHALKRASSGGHSEDDQEHFDNKYDHELDKLKRTDVAFNKRYDRNNKSESLIGEREKERSEYNANLVLHKQHDVKPQHHIYVSSRGKKKSIAGPFHSPEDAERHPARKYGDGVAHSDQIST